MDVVLVAGSETPIGRRLVEKLRGDGACVVTPVNLDKLSKNGRSDLQNSESSNFCVLDWNKSSWFSAKTVVRETYRRFGQLDAVWIIHTPSAVGVPFNELAAVDVDMVLDQSIRGTVALVHEIQSFLVRNNGFLGLVVPHHQGKPGPLDSLAEGAFMFFTDALIRQTPQELWCCGFIGGSPDIDGFADRLIELWKKQPSRLRGRWCGYPSSRLFASRAGLAESIRRSTKGSL